MTHSIPRRVCAILPPVIKNLEEFKKCDKLASVTSVKNFLQANKNRFGPRIWAKKTLGTLDKEKLRSFTYNATGGHGCVFDEAKYDAFQRDIPKRIEYSKSDTLLTGGVKSPLALYVTPRRSMSVARCGIPKMVKCLLKGDLTKVNKAKAD